MRLRNLHTLMAVLALLLWLLTTTSRGAITWNVSINDPGSTYQAYYAPIESNLSAALTEWSNCLASLHPSSIEIEISFSTSVTRSTGYSATSVFTNTVGGVNVYEQGVASEIRTGVDPNGATPDLYLKFQPSYLTDELWFDPNPQMRTTPVPATKTDAYSVLLHELTHAIGFNGWRDGTTGAIPGSPPYGSTFDQWETFDGTNLYFTGPAAEAVYGGPVPITFGNNWHVGNSSPRPGSDLLPDLMNGVVYNRGARYDISQLDLAMLSDAGVAVVLPHWTGTSSTTWSDNGNWSGPVPGTTAFTTNTDTAYFNQDAPHSPLNIDAGRNVKNITFDTASVNSVTLGAVGQALLLSSGGTIQTTSTVVNPQTINASLVLEGNYTFISGSSSSSATLGFGGGITPGATSGVTTLILKGSNPGANTISGILADNGSGQLSVTKDGPGVWILSGANIYSGDTTVLAGTLKFNVSSGTPTIAAGVTATIAASATLELAGSNSALGTTGGNRVHVVNNSTSSGVVVSGTNQVVGAIDGSGNTQVYARGDLTADHIIQNALIIGGSAGSRALVTIAASDSSGNPLGESSSLALAGSSAPSAPFDAGISSASSIGGPPNGESGSTASLLSSSPGTAGSSAVPEPTTIDLFAIALAGLLVGPYCARRRVV